MPQTRRPPPIPPQLPRNSKENADNAPEAGRRNLRQVDELDVQIAENLRVARRTAGLSQMELALALGVSYQQYQKYERAQNRVSGSVLFRSAEILKVSSDALLPTRHDGLGKRGALPAAAPSRDAPPTYAPDAALNSGEGKAAPRAGRTLGLAPRAQGGLSEFAELCERIVSLKSPRLKRALLEILEESCANDVAALVEEDAAKAAT